MFEAYKEWCEAHGFRFAIYNGHFYWATNYQTCEVMPNGCMIWHNEDYFNQILQQISN